MAVTVLFLVIFEAESTVESFEVIEQFLIFQCVLLVLDLLFFLFRSGKMTSSPNDANETFSDRARRMSKMEIFSSVCSLLLYMAQIGWLVYGNYLYFNLPVDVPDIYYEVSGSSLID